jgi:hypothetical protein
LLSIFQKKENKLKMAGAQKTTHPGDSADVTLASSVCKFHQHGHCKFGELCKHFHSQNNCFILNCDDSNCKDRHPRLCVYHMRFGHCRFGSSCSYLHTTLTPQTDVPENILHNEIIKLKETLESVVAALKNKEIEMKVLEQRIFCIESKASADDKFACIQCEYKAASSTALKTHMTKKHKSECLRDSSSEKDLNVSIPSQHRDISPSSKKCDQIPPFGWELNTCGSCDQTFSKSHDFKDHMMEYHQLSEDCSNCYGCEETFDQQSLGQFEIFHSVIHVKCMACQYEDLSPGGHDTISCVPN